MSASLIFGRPCKSDIFVWGVSVECSDVADWLGPIVASILREDQDSWEESDWPCRERNSVRKQHPLTCHVQHQSDRYRTNYPLSPLKLLLMEQISCNACNVFLSDGNDVFFLVFLWLSEMLMFLVRGVGTLIIQKRSRTLRHLAQVGGSDCRLQPLGTQLS